MAVIEEGTPGFRLCRACMPLKQWRNVLSLNNEKLDRSYID